MQVLSEGYVASMKLLDSSFLNELRRELEAAEVRALANRTEAL